MAEYEIICTFPYRDEVFESFYFETAIKFLEIICGEPPGGYRFRVIRQEYDENENYNALALTIIDDPEDHSSFPNKYYGKCMRMMEEFEKLDWGLLFAADNIEDEDTEKE